MSDALNIISGAVAANGQGIFDNLKGMHAEEGGLKSGNHKGDGLLRSALLWTAGKALGGVASIPIVNKGINFVKSVPGKVMSKIKGLGGGAAETADVAEVTSTSSKVAAGATDATGLYSPKAASAALDAAMEGGGAAAKTASVGAEAAAVGAEGAAVAGATASTLGKAANIAKFAGRAAPVVQAGVLVYQTGDLMAHPEKVEKFAAETEKKGVLARAWAGFSNQPAAIAAFAKKTGELVSTWSDVAESKRAADAAQKALDTKYPNWKEKINALKSIPNTQVSSDLKELNSQRDVHSFQLENQPLLGRTTPVPASKPGLESPKVTKDSSKEKVLVH